MNNTSLWVLVFMLAVVGCKQKTTGDHGHDHEAGGLEPLAYTLYSDKTELFVEFKPLVAGSTSKFATHLTILGDTFKPLIDAKVTVSLIVGDNGLRASTDSASSPGIFRLALKPGIVGKGKLVFEIVTEHYTDKIVIDDVTIYPNEKSALDNQVNKADNGSLTYLKEQAWKVAFANQPLTKTPFSGVIKTSGIITSSPGDQAIVSAKADGIVRFANGLLTVGTFVNAGTNMFTLSGEGIAQGNIESAFQQAKASYNQAKANYDRAKVLIEDQIISQKDFLDAKVTFENAQTAFNALSKNYASGSGQRNTAPISGYITNIHVSEGQYVTTGTPLATVSKNQRLLLQANVSQKYFSQLSFITSANFKVSGKEGVYSTEKLNGKVISYGRSTGGVASYVPVIFEIDNTENFVSGSAAEVYLKSSEKTEALVIPASALVEEQGNFFVYVQTGGESFVKREIKTGNTDGQNIEVLQGVDEGERVVTKGAYQIKLSTASGTLPAHGHEH